MEIPKHYNKSELKNFNIKLDVTKSNDVLKKDEIKVHDFFGKSKLINKMSDIFPQNTDSDMDFLS